MNMDDLKTLQAPLKERYRSEPDAAFITLKAEGRIGERVTCSIQTGRAVVAFSCSSAQVCVLVRNTRRRTDFRLCPNVSTNIRMRRYLPVFGSRTMGPSP